MSDRGIPVAEVGVAERARRLQVEDVLVGAVRDQPEVPDPTVVEVEHRWWRLSQRVQIVVSVGRGGADTAPRRAVAGTPNAQRRYPIFTRIIPDARVWYRRPSDARCQARGTMDLGCEGVKPLSGRGIVGR